MTDVSDLGDKLPSTKNWDCTRKTSSPIFLWGSGVRGKGLRKGMRA